MHEGTPDNSPAASSGTEVIPYQDFPVAPIEEGGNIVPYISQGGEVVPSGVVLPEGEEVLPQHTEQIAAESVESVNEGIYAQYGDIDAPDRVAERLAEDMEERRRKREEDAYMRLLARMVARQMSGDTYVGDSYYSRYRPEFLTDIDSAVRNSQMPTFEEIRMKYPDVSFEDDEDTESEVEEPVSQISTDTAPFQGNAPQDVTTREGEFQRVEDLSALEFSATPQPEVPALSYDPSSTLEIPLPIGREEVVIEQTKTPA